MPESVAPTPNLQDPVALLLINGTSVEQAQMFCMSKGLDPEDAKAIVSAARKRITITADYARDEQIGIAIARLNDVYSKSIVSADYRTALMAQKELSRLLSLHAPSGKNPTGDQDGVDAETVREQLQLIADYLLPLKLTSDKYPLEEHARLAAETIRTNNLAKL